MQFPPFATLAIYIRNLDQTLANRLKRFMIEPKVGSDHFAILMERITKHISTYKTETIKRKTASEVLLLLAKEFTQLTNKDLNIPNKEAEIKRATMVLLGALLHRYFRLIKDYDNYSLGLFSLGDVSDCKLFQAIRAVLGLPADTRARDLTILDGATIVSALEVFRDTMLENDRYKTYPHLKADPNFKEYLQNIINDHKSDATTTILKQYKAVSFIQSLMKSLEAEHKQIKSVLEKWVPILKATHSDFNKLGFKQGENYFQLSNEALEKQVLAKIIAHLEKNIADPSLRRRLVDLFLEPDVIEEYGSLTYDTLSEKLLTAYEDTAECIILGGCVLVKQSDEFQCLIFASLHLCSIPTNKESHSALSMLEKFIKDRPEIALDLDYFRTDKDDSEEVLKERLNETIDATQFDFNVLILKDKPAEQKVEEDEQEDEEEQDESQFAVVKP
jgi:hypothetical protein